MNGWVCDWKPDDLNEGPDCPYCAGDMCARFDGLGCIHNRVERHGYEHGRSMEQEMADWKKPNSPRPLYCTWCTFDGHTISECPDWLKTFE